MLRIASTEIEPGDRVFWLRSLGRSFLRGWRVQEIPGIVVRVCARRIRIKVRFGKEEKLIFVDPENVLLDPHSPH